VKFGEESGVRGDENGRGDDVKVEDEYQVTSSIPFHFYFFNY
jgi:hypothetical protein